MKSDIINDLNPQQREAVTRMYGPSVIIAGAGSGKTRVLVSKVRYVMEEKKVEGGAIVMITFTNKAANEMKERIKRDLGFVGTFHALCARILRRRGPAVGVDHDFIIYDDDDQQQAMKAILKDLGVERFTPGYFLNRISSAKNLLITASQFATLFSDHNAALVAKVYGAYQNKIKKNHGLDFDDLIMMTVQLLIRNEDILTEYQEKYRYVLVDEFQDTNYAQYSLTRLLTERYRNITVVGDFSQSIYSWRGADIRNLDKFQEDYPDAKIFHLEQNYRSTQNILNFAYDVISKNQTHPILQLFTNNQRGDEVEFYEAENEEHEAIYVAEMIKRLVKKTPYSSISILYRTNAQSRIIEEAFLHYGIPYVLIGGTRFYERKEIKDVLSYLRLIVHKDDELSRERIKKIGKKREEKFQQYVDEAHDQISTKNTADFMEEIFRETGYLQLYNPDSEEEYARLENIKELKSVAMSHPNLLDFLEQVALVESEYFAGEKTAGLNAESATDDRVRLMTLHQAKGLEFAYVFIIGVEEGILPHARSIDTVHELEEERRLFYVGITRAKKKLFITHATRRFIFGRRNNAVASRFINDKWEEWSIF